MAAPDTRIPIARMSSFRFLADMRGRNRVRQLVGTMPPEGGTQTSLNLKRHFDAHLDLDGSGSEGPRCFVRLRGPGGAGDEVAVPEVGRASPVFLRLGNPEDAAEFRAEQFGHLGRLLAGCLNRFQTGLG